MSYARFADDSDVYVFYSVADALECCGCHISDEWEHYSVDDMLAHLREHRTRGEKVPERAFRFLEVDREWITSELAEAHPPKVQS